jgi:heme-degrading monooxygenase HmoA
MVIERAQIDVKPGEEEAFAAALREAREVVASSPGFRSVTLGRGIEQPSRFLLLVEWETLEDHTVGFRESDRFTRWRELIGPYFAAAPDVEHYEPVDLGAQRAATAM